MGGTREIQHQPLHLHQSQHAANTTPDGNSKRQPLNASIIASLCPCCSTCQSVHRCWRHAAAPTRGAPSPRPSADGPEVGGRPARHPFREAEGHEVLHQGSARGQWQLHPLEAGDEVSRVVLAVGAPRAHMPRESVQHPDLPGMTPAAEAWCAGI